MHSATYRAIRPLAVILTRLSPVMNKKLSHSEIEALDFAVNVEDGYGFSVINMRPQTLKYFLAPETEYFNLLTAAPVMYKTLSHNFKSLEVIRESINNLIISIPVLDEELKALQNFNVLFDKAINDLQKGICLAQSVAREGI